MSSPERPSKENLSKILDMNKAILQLLPKGDSMRIMYEKMITRLSERIETYDQFYVNPYSTHTSNFSYHGDKDIIEHGGEYISGDDRSY
tara:strand:+ start:10463 stop:10729 length:267 start_codon:yes stop_codon:yes gene_type:complete